LNLQPQANDAELVESTAQTAWQPITPQGVAAFARAPWRRLLLVQLIVALLVGCGIAWFANTSYFPIISEAIVRLPKSGEIRNGQLRWQSESPLVLAKNNFLAFTVDLEHGGKLRTTAHVQFEFGRTNVRIQSLLGYLELGYPRDWIIAANRTELEPLWGAWRPHTLALTILGVALYLMASWYALATLYAGPVWYLAYFVNRDLTWRSSWRLCGGAVLPGALLMLLCISFYALGVMDLVQLGFIFIAHLMLGWIYLLVAIHFVPPVSEKTPAKNPFQPGAK
jgi:hypothetical protein